MGVEINFIEFDSNVCECGEWEDWHDKQGCILRGQCTPIPCKQFKFSHVEKRKKYSFKTIQILSNNPEFKNCDHQGRILTGFDEDNLEAKYFCNKCKSIIIRKPKFACVVEERG